jgi:hypothetical protein
MAAAATIKAPKILEYGIVLALRSCEWWRILPPARFPGLPEPEVSKDGESDDHDPDDVEHVHALLSFLLH